MAPEDELKLTQLCQHGHSDLVIMMCHGQGLTVTAILILVLRHNWLISEDEKQWELGDYYVTFQKPFVTNFTKTHYFWKTEGSKERVDWVVDRIEEMITKFIKERTDE